MSRLTETHEYDDIINLPHHVSETHPRMPLSKRAAQFAPFAALSGYEDAVRETGRLTESRPELDEEELAFLDRRLQTLQKLLPDAPPVTIVTFVPDSKKAGGALVPHTGTIKKIDLSKRIIQMKDLSEIPIDDILSIDGL